MLHTSPLHAAAAIAELSADDSTTGLHLTGPMLLVALVAGIVSFMIGGAWYTVLFGRTWREGMGFSAEKVKSIFTLGRIVVAVVAELVAAVGIVVIQTTMPTEPWLTSLILGGVVVLAGVKLAVFDAKSAGLIVINAGYVIVTIAVLTAAVAGFGLRAA